MEAGGYRTMLDLFLVIFIRFNILFAYLALLCPLASPELPRHRYGLLKLALVALMPLQIAIVHLLEAPPLHINAGKP